MTGLTMYFIINQSREKQLHSKLKKGKTPIGCIWWKDQPIVVGRVREGCWKDSTRRPAVPSFDGTANASPLRLTPSQQDLHKDRSPFCRRALLLFFNGGEAVTRDMGGGILLSELRSSLTRLNFLPGWSTAVWRTLPSSLPRSHWRLAGTYCTALLLPASVSPQPSNYFQLCFLFWGCKLQQSFFSCSMVLATYVWARTLNNLVLLNLWYYRFNFHQHILIWKQMKEERPNKQQIEDTSTLFIKSWVSQYFVIDKTTVLCSRSFTEKKDHSIWAFV